jgi:hypothetical protein
MIIMYCLIKRDLKDNVINIVDSVFEPQYVPRMLIPILKHNRALIVTEPGVIPQKEGKYLITQDDKHKRYQLGSVSNTGIVFDSFVFTPTVEFSVVQYEYNDIREDEDIDVDKTLESLSQK